MLSQPAVIANWRPSPPKAWRIRARREQLDPVHAFGDLFANRGTSFVRRPDHLVVERILGTLRWIGIPADAAAGDLEAWAVEIAHGDRVADLHVAVAVSVRAHVARGGDTRLQVGLQVLNRDQHRPLCCHTRGTRVVHVRVRVDESGQHGCLAQIDHRHAGGNADLSLGTDIRDALAGNDHDLLRQHLTGGAVEEPPGANRHRSRGRRTRHDVAFGIHARRWTDEAPWTRRG